MPVDVRESRIDEIRDLLFKFTVSHRYELTDLGYEQDDFIQDCLLNMYRRQGLNHYDEAHCQSFESLIFLMAKNHLTDKKRAKYFAKSRQDADGKPIQLVSIQEPLGSSEEGECTLLDFLESSPDVFMVLQELQDLVPNERISPNYDLTWKQLLHKSMHQEPEEIALDVGISSSRISQLQSLLVKKVKEVYGF